MPGSIGKRARTSYHGWLFVAPCEIRSGSGAGRYQTLFEAVPQSVLPQAGQRNPTRTSRQPSRSPTNRLLPAQYRV